MKNRIVGIFLSLLIATVLFDGCSSRVKSAGIRFESDTFEFGTIEEGISLHHVFEFTNIGTDTLIVEDVHPTCGCTVAGDYDREVKPGQKGKIPVTLNTSGFDGYMAKTVKVKTNIPGKIDYFILTLEGTVKVSANVNPKVLSFGNVERDRTTPLEGKIIISNRSQSPFTITDVVRASDGIAIPNVTVSTENVETKIETLKTGFVYALTVTVRPPFKRGQVMGIIRVKTDSTVLPEINTQFTYSTEPMVRVYPNPLFVSKKDIEKGTEQLINVVCEPGPEMRIDGLSVNIDTVKASVREVERGRRYTIVLKFPKNFTFDPANTLTVKFTARNVPDEPVFGIPVLGI
jgi:hypothetical protein